MNDLPNENEGRPLRDYEDFRADVLERKRRWWARLLNFESVGRPPGRRPHDLEQDLLLIARSRRRLAERRGMWPERRVPAPRETKAD